MCRSALHLAARAGALDVLEVLLEDLEKADRLEYVNAADKSGITPVFLAKQRGRNTSFVQSVSLVACEPDGIDADKLSCGGVSRLV